MLMGTGLIYAGFQLIHKTSLKGLTPQDFTEYLEYLLGDHVAGLACHGADGGFISGPSWPLILSYEHAIRKRMVRYVDKGKTIKEALKAAQEDPVTKERYFTTPLCVEGASRKRPHPQ